jgi:Protein of unknown function (DUF1592)/Protein of unknown function (DUF1588)/Protein of unknown function (DUF1595)/Protein of unknown function (DUF1585)/Protein of unknown function (DUF1587)
MKRLHTSSRLTPGHLQQATAVVLFSMLSCTGVVGTATLPGPGSGAPGSPGNEPVPPKALTEFVTSPQLRRLSQNEYKHSVADLFSDATLEAQVPLEQVLAGHSQIAGAQKVGYEDTNAFLGTAELIAEKKAAALDAQVKKCADGACVKDWVEKFLSRAFRGPVSAEVLARYVETLNAAEAGDTSVDRMKTLVMSALSSPEFLYRKEIGSGGPASTIRSLSDYEIASRLSALVWQSLPDNELAAAARAGMLQEGAQRQAQFERMLQDPKASRGLRAFVADWMGLSVNRVSGKSMRTLDQTSSALATDAEKSFELLVDDALIANKSGRFSDVLTIDSAFVNSALAPVYQVAAPQNGFEKVKLPLGERRGLLTQTLVLAAHTKESGVSPFPLGKFILENVTCESVGNPPASFPTVEDKPDSANTLRKELEAKTSGPACIYCHQRISPVGFAFLPFDPIGRYKAVDGAGRPFDTSGSFTFERSQNTVQFANASELSEKLAAQADLQKCVARRLFRFNYGRYEAAADEAALAQLEGAAVDSQTATAALMRKLVVAEDFQRVRVQVP